MTNDVQIEYIYMATLTEILVGNDFYSEQIVIIDYKYIDLIIY